MGPVEKPIYPSPQAERDEGSKGLFRGVGRPHPTLRRNQLQPDLVEGFEFRIDRGFDPSKLRTAQAQPEVNRERSNRRGVPATTVLRVFQQALPVWVIGSCGFQRPELKLGSFAHILNY